MANFEKEEGTLPSNMSMRAKTLCIYFGGSFPFLLKTGRPKFEIERNLYYFVLFFTIFIVLFNFNFKFRYIMTQRNVLDNRKVTVYY